MPVRPGVNVLLRSTPPSRTPPTNISTSFVIGTSDAGPVTPVLIQNMADFTRIFGGRTSYSVVYDALDVYFREGGGRAYFTRVVGPAATVATHIFLDGSAVAALNCSSLGPGAFYNSIKVGIRAGQGAGNFVVFVQDANNVEVETSPDLADGPSAVLWAQGSAYIRFTLGTSVNDPANVAAVALAGGNDDRNNITDVQWQAALDANTFDLGVGQVWAPGRTTDPGHLQLLAHAFANNRLALLDGADTSIIATLTAAVTACRAGNQRWGGMFWPWCICPGIVVGTTRSVPPSALVAGLLARNDSIGLGPNAPAAGDNGVASYVFDLSQPAVSDATRTTLNGSGIDVIRDIYGSPRVYGWRTLVDAVADANWVSLGNSRLYMAIAGDGAAIAEGFVFDKIDGQGKLIAAFNGALSGMLQQYYNTGDLYGVSASEAFFVDTGPQVNTPTTLQNNELHAVLNVKMSPFAEMVQIEIYKRAITEGVTV